MINLLQFDTCRTKFGFYVQKPIHSTLPEGVNDELEPILRKMFMGYASGNFSDFESQKQKDQQRQITMQ